MSAFGLSGTVDVNVGRAQQQLRTLRGEIQRTTTELQNLDRAGGKGSGRGARAAGAEQVRATQQAARQALQAQQQADRLSAQSARQTSQQRAQAARDAARVTAQSAQQAARAQVQAQQQAARAVAQSAQQSARAQAQAQQQASRLATQAVQQAARTQARAQQQASRLAAQASRDAAREIARNSRAAAQEAGRNSRAAAQEAARNSREAARVAQQAARETARIAREAARESARLSREAAKAAERAARETTRAIEREAKAQARAKLQADRELDRALQRRERERAARAARAERERQSQVNEGRAAAGQLGDRGSQTATRGGLAVAGGLALATREAILWESAFTGVTKTVNATDKQLSGLAASLRQMALEIPVNANELANIAQSAGQLGIEFDKLGDFTKTIAALSVSTNLASEEGATSLARYANITKISQAEFSNLGSSLVDLGNNFATTEAEIMEMSLRLASAGSLAGIKAPEILGFATALSSVGINAEAGGTAMSKAFNIIDKAVREGGDKLEVFAKTSGVSAQAFQKHFKSDASGAILEFVRGLGKIKTAGGDVNATLTDVGMKNAYISNAMRSLAANPELLARALSKSNTAWKENTALAVEAGKRYATSASQIAISQNNLREFGIIVGTTVVPALVDLLNSIKPAFEWFRSLSKEQQSSYVKMAALAGVTLLLAGRIKPLVDTAMLARTAFIGLRAAWSGAVIAGGPMAGLLTTLSAVAFPAIVIAAGAATVAVGLWAIANEKGKESAARLEAANAGVAASATIVGKTFEKLKTVAAVNPQAAKQVEELRKQYEKLSGSAEDLKKFKKVLADAKGQITVGVKGAQKVAIDKEINRLQRDVDRSIGERKFKATVTAEANKGALAKVKEAFMQTFGAIYTAWKANTITPMVATAKWGWGQISYIGRESWRGIKIGFNILKTALSTAWYSLTGGFESSTNQMVRKIADSITGLMGRLINSVKNTWNNFKRWYTGQSANYGETDANAPSIPAYAVGSQNVPKTEVALVHKGEMIIPAKEAAEVRAGRAQPGGSKSGGASRVTTISVPMPGYMKSLFAKVGQETKVECGQAISNALGSPRFATKVAQGLAGRTVRPDRNGRLPDGAVVSQSYGKKAQHFFVVYTDRNGVQRKLESTTAGGKGRHYRSDRKITKNDLKRITRAALPRGVSGARIGAPFGNGGPSWNPEFDGSQFSNQPNAEPKKPYIPPYIVAKREADTTLKAARRDESEAIKMHAQQLKFATKNGVGPSLDAFTARLQKINSLWRDKDSPVVKLFENKQTKSANKAFAELMGQYDADVQRKNQLQQLQDLQEQNRRIADEKREADKRAQDEAKARDDARTSLLGTGTTESGDLEQRQKLALEGKSLEEINTLLEEQTKWRERVAQLQTAGWDRAGAESIANEAAATEAYNRALKGRLDAEEEALARTPELYTQAINKMPSLGDIVGKASQQLGDVMHSGSNNAQEMRDALAALPPTLLDVMAAMDAAGPAADKAREKYAEFFKLLTESNAEIVRREAATADELTRPYREATARLDELDADLDQRLRRMGAYDFKSRRTLEIQTDMKRDGLPDDPARVGKIVKREEWVNQLEQVTGSMHSIFEGAFRDTEGGFKGMFDNIFDGFQKMLTDMAAEYLANFVMQQIFGAFMGSIGPKPSMGGGTGISLSGLGGAGGKSGGFMGGGAGLGGGFSLGRSNGSFATGLDEVPWDGFTGTLHRGEAVLNRQAADAWRNQTRERDESLIGAGRRVSSGGGSGAGGGDTIIQMNGPITITTPNPRKFPDDVSSALPKREIRRRGRNMLGV